MEPCKFENTIIEMAGDIKVLVSEFKAMNGSIRDTKTDFKEHKIDSKAYRHKIDIVWGACNSIKWAIILLFGTGIIWKVFELWIK